MRIAEHRRIKILQRLLTIDLSIKDELKDILKLATTVCKVPISLLSLVDTENQNLIIKSTKNTTSIPLKDSFCIHTLKSNGIMEVKDALLDPRFCNNRDVVGKHKLRYYAGVPLYMADGEVLGCLVVIDKKPNALNKEQKKLLRIIAKQVMYILEFQLSLGLLKAEIKKVQESEIKLKWIIENSSDIHILLDKNLNILAFNQTAAKLCLQLKGKRLTENKSIVDFASEEMQQFFKESAMDVLQGKTIHIERKIYYSDNEYRWWNIFFKPVYNHNHTLIGAMLNLTDTTESNNYKEHLISQNIKLRRIAYVQSHDIRRPLANIIGIAKLLQEPEDADVSENLDHLLTEANELDNKIKNIVSLTNVD